MDWLGAPYRSRRIDPATRELYQTVGKNIMACRHMRGMSTSDLAMATLIPEGVLLAYEAGSGRVPASDLVRIIEVCEVAVGRMFVSAELPTPHQSEGAPAQRVS